VLHRTSALVGIVLCVHACASQRLELDSIATLIREYSSLQNPDLNPDCQLSVTEYAVQGLWDSLGVQIVKARYLGEDSTQFNEHEFICLNGAVRPFASTFGGYGLMSGLVFRKVFYYTFSWGSGIHRSHAGCFFLDHDSLVIVQSGGYFWMDLFVSKTAGETWTAAMPIATARDG